MNASDALAFGLARTVAGAGARAARRARRDAGRRRRGRRRRSPRRRRPRRRPRTSCGRRGRRCRRRAPGSASPNVDLDLLGPGDGRRSRAISASRTGRSPGRWSVPRKRDARLLARRKPLADDGDAVAGLDVGRRDVEHLRRAAAPAARARPGRADEPRSPAKANATAKRRQGARPVHRCRWRSEL